MGSATLTDSGRRWAQDHSADSIVCRIALLADAGMAEDWPPQYRTTAVESVNAMAADHA